MPVRILEVEPAPAIMMINLALLPLAWVGPVGELARTNSLEDRIEIRLVDQEGVMLARNLAVGVHVVEVRSVVGLDHDERSPPRWSGQPQHLGEKLCGCLA